MKNDSPNLTETELLARALFRGFLQLVKSIAAIYGWSIKDENGDLLAEQCQQCRAARLTSSVTLRKVIKLNRKDG